MAKRKIPSETSSEAISANLKKPRNELSKYSLYILNTAFSKQPVQEETDESDDYQTFTTDKINDVNLLLHHLSDENASEVEKFIKKCFKEERSHHRGSQHFRGSHLCLKATFQFILKSLDTLSDVVIDKLSLCFSNSKLSLLCDDFLNEYLEIFAENTVKSNKINQKIGSIVANIAKQITSPENFVYSLFLQILNTCIKPSNEFLLIELIRIFDNIYQQDLNGSDLAALIFGSIFKLWPESNLGRKPSLGSDLTVIWSVKGLRKLFSVISLDKYDSKLMPQIYEALISCVVHCQRSLSEKADYLSLESESIACLTSNLKRTDSKRKRQEACVAFSQAFLEMVKKNADRLILDRFFIGLFMAGLDCLEGTAELNRGFVDGMKKLFEKSFHSKKAGWIESCMKVKNPIDELNNLFAFKRLAMIVGEPVVQRSLMCMCKFILENHVKVEIESLVEVPANTSEFFSQFVIKSITQIFIHTSKKNRSEVLTSSTDPSIVLTLFYNCFSIDHQRAYIDHLALFLDDPQVKTILSDKTSPELDKFRKKVIDYLRKTPHKYIAKSKSNFGYLQEFSSYKLAIHLLDACRVIFISAKSNYLTDLISYLTAMNTPTSRDDLKRLSVHGLLSVLKSINSSESKNNCENIRLSSSILESLKTFINRPDKQNQGTSLVELKSDIYQSLYSIINIQPKLIKPVTSLLLDQINKVVLSSTGCSENEQFIIDLSKCVSVNDSRLIEPVDVLLHVADMCTRLCLETTFNDPILTQLQSIIRKIAFYYEVNSPLTIFSLYKSQVVNSHIGRTMPLVHKLVMGLIDVLIEHQVTDQKYTKIAKMLEHYDTTTSLISADIETAMTLTKQEPVTPQTNLKRKKFEKPAQIIKRFCNFNKSGHSSEGATTSTNPSKLSRKPFTDLTNLASSQSQLSEQKTSPLKSATAIADRQTDKSFINIQFTYVPRISYSCCVRLLQLIQCSDPSDISIIPRVFSDFTTRSALISLITNKKFADYIIKLVERKLKALVSCDDQVYDPESFTKEQIFSLFLTKLWTNFCQRLNGTVNETGLSTFTGVSRHQFSQTFFIKSLKFISFCQMIWKLVQARFNNQTYQLLVDERSIYEIYDEPIANTYSPNIHQLTWRFILNCARTVKLYLSPAGPKQTFASKCCSGMFNLILDIIKTLDLTHFEYTQLSNWVTGLACESMACDGEAYKAIIYMMMYLEGKYSSQAVILKSLLMDYSQYVKLMNVEEENDSDESFVETTSMVQQFQLVGAFNSGEYVKFVLDRLIDLLAELRWVVTGDGKGFIREKLLSMVVRQMVTVVKGLEAVLRVLFSLEAVECVVNALIVFYDCVGSLFESTLVNGMSLDEIDAVKFLIGRIALSVKNVLAEEWPVVRELFISEEESNEEKVNANDFERFSRYKKLISDLETAISGFEKSVNLLNDKLKDVDILEQYNTSVSSLELNFNYKVTRTISVSQMEQSWISQCSNSQDRREL